MIKTKVTKARHNEKYLGLCNRKYITTFKKEIGQK